MWIFAKSWKITVWNNSFLNSKQNEFKRFEVEVPKDATAIYWLTPEGLSVQDVGTSPAQPERLMLNCHLDDENYELKLVAGKNKGVYELITLKTEEAE